MAFLRIRRLGKGRYYYIVKNFRRGGKRRQKILEYLGREPSQRAIARALEYWGIRKPRKESAPKPPVKMLTVHPLGPAPVAALTGRVQSVPMADCPPCSKAVQHYRARCIGTDCGSETLSDLLTPHARGGRVYCAKCFTLEVDDYEAVQRGKAEGTTPRWVRRSHREIGMAARWPENWRVWHTHGLEWVLMSGHVAASLFTDSPARTGDQVLASFPDPEDSVRWASRIAGYLLAGVGAEILLKGTYLKAGYSIRRPQRREPLARLGTPEDTRSDPYLSASFGALLSDQNLRLICADPALYRPLTVAMRWRDPAAHVVVNATGDAGVHLVMLGAALRALHNVLMKDADAAHVQAIQRILTETKPIHFSPITSGGHDSKRVPARP